MPEQAPAGTIGARLLKRSIWFDRLILFLGVLLFAQLALSDIADPISVGARTHTALGSPDAITAVRTQGGVLIGIAVCLAYCLASERRLLPGLGFLTTIITGVSGARLIGLTVDGTGPVTRLALRAEVILTLLSAAALLLERRRSQNLAGAARVPLR